MCSYTGYGELGNRLTAAARGHCRLITPPMASLLIISWRDIPAQVIVKRGSRDRQGAAVRSASRWRSTALPCAPARGSSDAYLADWKRGAPRPCGEDLQAEAAAEAAPLKSQFSDS